MNGRLYDESGDEPLLSAEGMSVLFGVPLDEFRAEIDRQGEQFRVPVVWVKSGRRRQKEYAAHTGGDDMRGALDWLAERDGGVL